MSETGSAALSQGSRAVESASRLLIEIIRMLADARGRRLRNQLTNEQLRSYRESRGLRDTIGLVNTEKLYKLAQRNGTEIIPTEAKINRNQLYELEKLSKEYGFAFSAVGDKSHDKEISDCEEIIGYLAHKGDYIYEDIKGVEARRNEYVKSVEAAGKTVNDAQLEKFDEEIRALRDKLNNLEYLNDNEKAEYREAYEKLHGNIAENKIGLYEQRDEVTLLIPKSDLQKLLMCSEQLKRNTMEENVAKHIDYLKTKEAHEGLTVEETEKLNGLLHAEEKLLNENALLHNGATKKEIFENMFNSLSTTQKTAENKDIDFSYATNRLVEQEIVGSGKPLYIVNPDNPENYIKVSREYNSDMQRTVHTYDVYKDGVEQIASERFNTRGVYTDRDSKTADGSNKFIDENGKEVPRGTKGGKMYWTALRQEMAQKTEMNGNRVFVFYDEQQFNEYRAAYKEYKEEATRNMEKNSYDIVENLELSPEEVAEFENSVTTTDFYDTPSLIADCKEEIGKQGFSYTPPVIGKESFVRNRSNDEKMTFEKLKERLSENPNDKGAAIIACNMKKIQLYMEVEKVQLDIYAKSGSILDEQGKSELAELSKQKDTLINEIQACDNGLSAYLSEDRTREAIEKDMPNKTEITHGEHIEEFENPTTVQEWKEQADVERAAQAAASNTANTNRLNIANEHNAANIPVKSAPDIGDK